MSTTLVAFDCGAAFPLNNRTVTTIITEHLEECAACERLDQALDHRNEMYSTVATMGDRDADWLNKHADDDDFPLETSGDALALYGERHS